MNSADDRVCVDCLHGYPASAEFFDLWRRRGREALAPYCRACRRLRKKVTRARSADTRNAAARTAKANQRAKFGIDGLAFAAMASAQDGRCAICREPETVVDPRRGTARDLAIDHDHTTGRVRGLLCYRCNVGLGLFKEDQTRLHRAIAYLTGTTDGR